MLGFFVPDPLQRFLVDVVSGLPIVLQQSAFVLLCVCFIIGLSRMMRWLLLCLDVELALRSQRVNQRVGTPAEIVGRLALGQWWIFVVLGIVAVTATIAFSGLRAAQFDPDSLPYSLARMLQICLSPNTGNGDSMARCLSG